MLRDPNPAEKPVIDKLVYALNDAYGQFNPNDWKQTEDRVNMPIKVATRPVVPIDMNTDFHRSYSTIENSPRFQNVLQPVLTQLEAASNGSDEAKISELQKRFNELQTVSMEAHVNWTSAKAPPPSQPSDLHVSGAAFAYRVPDDVCAWNDSARGQCWLVAFGDWRKDEYDSKYHVYNFKFKHPGGSPYIENVIITMRGAPDVVPKMLSNPVWGEVAQSITP